MAKQEGHALKQDYSLQAAGLGASFGARVILAEVDFTLPTHGITALLGPVSYTHLTLPTILLV